MSFRRLSLRHVVPDALIIVASLFISLYLRVGGHEFFDHFATLMRYLPLFLVMRTGTFIAMGTYNVLWRYISTMDAVRVFLAVAASTVMVLAASYFSLEIGRLPRSLFIIDAVVVTLLLMGVRLQRRVRFERKSGKASRHGRRTLIYGAGENGRTLAHRVRHDGALQSHLVGFVDDDPKKRGMVIGNIPVLGRREDLANILRDNHVSQLIIAISSLNGDALREIVQTCLPFNIKPRIITDLTQFQDTSTKNIDIYREIDLHDLLNRPARTMDLSSVKQMLRGKCVLITGAGGSIGSELARQIYSHEPARLLLLDHSEFNLYEIDKELRQSTRDTRQIVPLLLDLKDRMALEAVMKQHLPEIVFHAAAYKHVHLVEANPFSAILNNVMSTQGLLEISQQIGVQTLVQISTDKAVNPVGVMGLTKRVCELITTAAGKSSGRRYCSVRFGNVLGSSGSLIPLLQKQIQDGGPLTITHPDMMRYFMLIPEAVSLVLKAATMARPGDIHVLRMGSPVKIVDIAHALLALLGKSEQEIPIVFTGLRPGEKMFEELYLRGDELQTEHPDILTLPDGEMELAAFHSDFMVLRNNVDRMVSAAKHGDKEALHIINRVVKTTALPAQDVPSPPSANRFS